MYQQSYAPGIPLLLSRVPGDIGPLAVLSVSRLLSHELPRSWSVEHLWERDEIPALEEPFSAVVVDWRGAAIRQVEERIQWLTQRDIFRDAELLLLDSSHTAELLLQLPQAQLLPQDSRPLARRIHESVSRGVLVWLKTHLTRRLGNGPQVSQFLRRCLVQKIPSHVQVAETDTVAGITYTRRVKDAATVLGWSRSYLYQHLPFNASDALRAFAFIHGLLLYSPGVTPWSVVATRLGFYDAADWNHFCKRLAGVRPSELCDRTRGEWIRPAMDRAFGCEPGEGERSVG